MHKRIFVLSFDTDGSRSMTRAADCNIEPFDNKPTTSHVGVEPSETWTTRSPRTSNEKMKGIIRRKLPARFRANAARRAVMRQ